MSNALLLFVIWLASSLVVAAYAGFLAAIAIIVARWFL